MEKYQAYTTEELIWDNQFRQWVLSPTSEANAQWHQWLMDNPDKWAMVQKASDIVRGLTIKEPLISDNEIKLMVQKTMQKALEKEENTAKIVEVIARHEATEGVAQELERPIISFYRQKWFRIAASIALIVSLGILWKVQEATKGLGMYEKLLAQNTPELIETINKTDIPQLITLSDGSVVTLKKGSRISYASPFIGTDRTVYLSGGAFFEIAKDPSKPFYVYANELVTKVLGTSFTVNAYKDDKEVTVEVKTGKVSVFAQNDPDVKEKTVSRALKGLVLTPNQKIVFNREAVQLTKTLVEEPLIVLAKKDQQTLNFNFEDTPANEVFEVLKKAYNINIVYDEAVLKNCPVTAPLTDQPLFEKLKIICKAIEAHSEVLDGQIIIQSKGCKN